MRLRKRSALRLKPSMLRGANAGRSNIEKSSTVLDGVLANPKSKRVRGRGAGRTKRDPYATVAATLEKLFPGVERELKFHPTRRWKFDFAWPLKRVALEIEGGVWTRGRHTRGSGFVRDMEKYNSAACRGWRILRCTPKQAHDGDIYPMLFVAMDFE